MRTLIGLALLSIAATLAHGGDLAPTAKAEIDALLKRLETSACQFYRNGTWYDGSAAKDHLQTKLDYLVKKGGVTTSEEFIEKVAAKSSLSGQPYKVRCPNEQEQPCAVWLTNELRRLREAHSK